MTGLLVRSTATKWAKGSVLAVDAGTHLGAVVSIFKEHLPNAVPKRSESSENRGPQTLLSQRRKSSLNGQEKGSGQSDAVEQLVLTTGPFADFELPHSTAKANAAYFVRNLITTYLITHPHLDHISGFVINTAGFQHTSRPKRLAGLPSTIDAFKTHIFNDIIWPNLSDEDGGVGLVSYMRLAEGGNLAIGEGEGRGYIEVCDGLAVKSWSVSHGKCMHNHSKHGSISGISQEIFAESGSRRPSQNLTTSTGSLSYGHPGYCVTDSSAFFLRDDHTGKEILIFGDVEPDSLSLSPRTAQIWSEAAPKIAKGLLKAILIECSYDESQSDETLFGHLAPRHVIEELLVLADKVQMHRNGELSGEAEASPSPLKRKRSSIGLGLQDDIDTRIPRRGRPRPSSSHGARRKSRKSNVSPASSLLPEEGDDHEEAAKTANVHNHDLEHHQHQQPHQMPSPGSTTIAEESSSSIIPTKQQGQLPLAGLQVIIIHVKDNLRDGQEAGEIILSQLADHEKQAQLGCDFAISKSGSSIWL